MRVFLIFLIFCIAASSFSVLANASVGDSCGSAAVGEVSGCAGCVNQTACQKTQANCSQESPSDIACKECAACYTSHVVGLLPEFSIVFRSQARVFVPPMLDLIPGDNPFSFLRPPKSVV